MFYFELVMALLSQRGKEIYRDDYNFIYTLNGKNKDGWKLYWTCARKKTCKASQVCHSQLCLASCR